MNHRALTLAIALGILAVPIALLMYDVVVFQPHRNDIKALLVNADPLDRSPPARVLAFIEAEQQGVSMTTAVSAHLNARFMPRRTMLHWHAHAVLWRLLVSMHLSEDEIRGLYSTLVYNGDGHGLNGLSNRMYARSLDMLSDEEIATVVAYTRAPGIFKRDPDRLLARRDALLSKVRSIGHAAPQVSLSPPS